VSNFSDIFLAAGDSSTLFKNVTDIDSTVISGYTFLKIANTNVESMPELRAIEIFLNFATCCEIVSVIMCSII